MPASYPLLSHEKHNRHTLVAINCYGTEARLSECSRHKGSADSICHGGEAGVICSSMFNQHSKNTVKLLYTVSLQMIPVRKAQFSWWEVMMSPEAEFSTAIREPGILYAVMAGILLERRLGLSAKL